MVDPPLYGMLLPLVLGLVLAAALPVRSDRLPAPIAGLVFGCALLVGSVGLEGFPAIPPVAAKQKAVVSIAIAIAIGLVAGATRKTPVAIAVAALTATATAAWIGWRPLGAGVGPPWLTLAALGGGGLLVASIATRLDSTHGTLAAGPAFLMTAAGLAAAAGFGGSATLAFFFGSIAASLGGVLLAAYLRTLRGGTGGAFGPAGNVTATTAIAGFAATLLYFTPDVSRAAVSIAAFAPVGVLLSERLPLAPPLDPKLRPFVRVAAGGIPALIALAFAIAGANAGVDDLY